jgi:hypothetical protein
MKKLLPALGFTLLLNFLTTTIIAQGKIFIYLNSHNEDNIGYLNMPGGYVNYTQSRDALVQLAQLTHSKGAKQNWGSDWVALKAIARYDTGTSLTTTNGKNLCRWMSEDMGVECDPHSHENTYNYGDVAYLMSQLGCHQVETSVAFCLGNCKTDTTGKIMMMVFRAILFPAIHGTRKCYGEAAHPTILTI